MARLRSIGISSIFSDVLYSSWRRWARLLLHCLRSIAGNSSGPPEKICEIVFIASMMSSLVIFMYDSAAVGVPRSHLSDNPGSLRHVPAVCRILYSDMWGLAGPLVT